MSLANGERGNCKTHPTFFKQLWLPLCRQQSTTDRENARPRMFLSKGICNQNKAPVRR